MRALVTGVTGQDGSYLAEELVRRGATVVGMVRRTSGVVADWLEPGAHVRLRGLTDAAAAGKFRLIAGDVTDLASCRAAVDDAAPDAVFNLAAQSFVGVSWTHPATTLAATGHGTVNMLEAVRSLCPPSTVFVQASSSEMFGNGGGRSLLDESTTLAPVSPYGAAKVYAHEMCRIYRESFAMNVVRAIMFNHESPRRGAEFVTQHVVRHAERIADAWSRGQSFEPMPIGNIEATRDWGFAPEYMNALADGADLVNEDFVLATGRSYSVAWWIGAVFRAVLPGSFAGWAGYDGAEELGRRLTDGLERLGGQRVVVPRSSQGRSNELWHLRGNAGKAHELLGWRAEAHGDALVRKMAHGEG